ncbi:MAG: lysylphosphatidylglycerol synthase transmembrane domain-containing protein, partial [Candidatus Zixiibacteriota bacterium]
MISKRAASILIGFVISVGAIYFVARDINFDEVVLALSGANYWLLLPNMAIVIFSMYQRAWRWGRMSAPIKRVEFGKLLSSTAIGFMANNILPLRLGEFVRAYSLSRQDPEITKSASLAMIFTERIIFDLAALLAILAIVLGVTEIEIEQSIKQNSLLILGVSLAGYFFALGVAKWPDRISAFVVRRLGFLPGGACDMIVRG